MTSIGEHQQYQMRIRRHVKFVGLGFGLALLLMLTTTPVFVYYFIPQTTMLDNNKPTSCQHIAKDLLNRSICSFAPSMSANKPENTKEFINVSVSGCGNFSQVDDDLRFLIAKLPQLQNESKNIELLCNVAFKECGDGHDPSNSLINCSEMIDAQNDFRTTLGDKASSCLTLPACARNGAYNSNETICPKPLIVSKSKLALEQGLGCSPACDQASWKSGVFGTSSYIITCVSVPLIWICTAVLFITWANARKLLSYQSVTGSCLLVSLSTLSTAATIPLILGPKRTFCKHESMVDSQNDPTTICYIQGLIGQFSYASCLIWWLTSVFNAVMTVWKPEKFGHRSDKKSLILQLTLLLLYVGGQATFVFIHDVKYTRKSPYGIVCTPESNVWLFYLTLPAVVAILCGTLMSVFVMVKLHQAREISLRGISEEKRYTIIEEYALVQKRFFLLCIIIPLSFASTMVTTIIHSKTLTKKYVNYSDCLVTTNRTEVDRCISQHLPDIGWIGTSISWILIDLCVIALVAYCLIPKSARIVWLKLWKKCKKRQFRERWRADTPEYSSEVTQLFSSTTERALNSLSED